jgi:hypothetical protein
MNLRSAAFTVVLSTLAVQTSCADQPTLIAISSISGQYEDFATQTAGLLENGVPGTSRARLTSA